MQDPFVILITASPLKTQAHLTATEFVKQCLSLNLPIKQVFFYQDAVLVANRLNTPPSDEPLVSEQWRQVLKLATEQDKSFELQACIAACCRRGVIDPQQAQEYDLDTDNLNSDFTLTGLGQLAASLSDPTSKLIHFK